MVVGRTPASDSSSGLDTQSPWLGHTFDRSPEPRSSQAHIDFAFKKSIFPTKRLYQFGLHAHGACAMDYPWSGCKESVTGLCYTSSKIEEDSPNVRIRNFRTTHSLIDQVKTSDMKKIGRNKEAVLYHMLFFRQHYVLSNDTDSEMKNEYAIKYFPQTMQALRKRNLDILIDTPLEVVLVPTVADSWLDYRVLYKTKDDKDYSASWFNRSALH